MNRGNRSSKSGRATQEKKKRKEKEEDSGSVAKANDDNVVLYLEKEVQTTDESLGQGKHADHHANEFDQLCDHVMSSCTALHNALHDFLTWKDEMLKQALPSAVLLRLTLIAGKLYRMYSGMHSHVCKLVEVVRLYSVPWEKKSTVLKKLQDDCKIKQGQLNVALHKIEMFAVQEQRMARDRTIKNWAKLFTKVTNRNSHGRRWKFLIQPLKDRIANGLPLLPPAEYRDGEEGSVALGLGRSIEGENYLKVDQDGEADSTAVERDSTFSPESFDTFTTDEQRGHRRVRFATDEGDSSDGSEVSEELSVLSADSPSGVSDTTCGTGVRTPNAVPVPIKVETAEAATWTHEKEYNKFLHVRVFQPTGFEELDVYCTLAVGPQLVSSRVFAPPKPPAKEESVTNSIPIDNDPSLKSLASRSNSRLTSSRLSLQSQSKSRLKSNSVIRIGYDKCDEFKFAMPADDKIISVTTKNNEIEESLKPTKPSFLQSGSLSALLSTSAVASSANAKTDTLNVAVHSNGPGRPMVAMTAISISGLSVEDYSGCEETPEENLVDAVSYDVVFLKGGGSGQVNLACYWTREERIRTKTRGTLTQPIERVLEGLGFIQPKTPPVLHNIEIQVQEEDITEEEQQNHTPEGFVKDNKVAELIIKHAEEMELLQSEYEDRLNALTVTLNQMRSEPTWTAVKSVTHSPSEPSTAKTKSRESGLSSSSDQKSQKQSRLFDPNAKLLGTSVPQDFLLRLEHFARESVRRQEELTQRVKSEVAEVCEKQMASLHRLDTRRRPTTENGEEEMCLPALFMPTKTRNVFTPRAHSYFHPMGSVTRLTQPPSVFKLPSIPGHVATLNLFNVSQEYMPQGQGWWRQEQEETGQQTVTPPPSNVNISEVQ